LYIRFLHNMKSKNSITVLIVVLAFFLSFCSSSKEEMVREIAKMEFNLKNSQTSDTTLVKALLGAYQSFASKYSSDGLAPENLYKAAGLALSFGHAQQAVELYESIVNSYPAYLKMPECKFMKAFAYETGIGDLGKAHTYYNTFLLEYPDHDLADDARTAIRYLGTTPEELLQDLEKRNIDSSISTR